MRERAAAFRADPEVREALTAAGVTELATPTAARLTTAATSTPAAMWAGSSLTP